VVPSKNPLLRRVESGLASLWSALPAAAPWVAIFAAATALSVGWHWGTFVVGGSDSHCYVGQAQMLASGRLSLAPPIEGSVPWANAPATFAPAGFTAKPPPSGDAVPICPAGLSVLMAVGLELAGPWGVFLVVPLLGGLAVWATYGLACRMYGPIAGLVAAVWLACSPIVLYQIVQPMSDIPAMAWWTFAIVGTVGPRRRPLLAGLAAAAAILTRPNLAPLVLFLAGLLSVKAHTEGPSLDQDAAGPLRFGDSGSSVFARLLWFGGGLLPGIVAVAWLQNAMYGSPLHSGYGGVAGLFSLDHVALNLRRYPAWLMASHGPIVLVAFVAPFLPGRRRETWWLAAFAAGVLAAYLPYVVFDDWWYLRFLLPALPVIVVLVARVVTNAVSRLAVAWRPLVLASLVGAVGITWVHTAGQRAVFQLATLEQKYPAAGDYVRSRLPANAVVIAGQESGSVRYYAGRPSLAWDAFEPASLDSAVAFLERRGYAAFFVLEPWEEIRFRDRFGAAAALGALDWPPVAQIGTDVRVYGASDRSRYLGGASVQTERIWIGRKGGR
jgi:hypothetical protein